MLMSSAHLGRSTFTRSRRVTRRRPRWVPGAERGPRDPLWRLGVRGGEPADAGRGPHRCAAPAGALGREHRALGEGLAWPPGRDPHSARHHRVQLPTSDVMGTEVYSFVES